MLIYWAAPTRNHYWDGIGFALNIEGVSQDEVGHQLREDPAGDVYYNPNHLLYNALGRALYRVVKSALPATRALDVLVGWSILSSVAAACMLFHLLLRRTGQQALSLWLTLLFAFSATWWKYSTDANAYVPGTAVLILCALLAARKGKQPVVLIGLGHALAMLLHQIAICFYPAMMVAIWKHPAWPDRAARYRAMLRYSLSAGVSVAVSYVAVWLAVLGRPADPKAFLAWVTFNGSDVLTRKTMAGWLADMWVANIRVFFGGKASLALSYLEWPLLIPVALVVTSCALLLGRALWRQRTLWQKRTQWQKRTEWQKRTQWRWPQWKPGGEQAFALVWLGSFLAFLSVWLTEYQYYRLFCLPALILWLGAWLKDTSFRVRWSDPLPAFVVLMASLNFAMYIGPYARVEASPPLKVALEARNVLAEDGVVYFTHFDCDNWWMKYFNMGTTWRQAPLDNPEELAAEVDALLRSGRRVYFDTTLYGQLSASNRAKLRLSKAFKFDHALGFANRKHHIQFVEVKPREI
ncbi:MAG: hypothetical protein NTV70_02510 [Acidobacteria bacterium]|nr:hypothetical protein [Acidobacteriota bacterium]